MFNFLRKRRFSVETDAQELISAFGVDAYFEARNRARWAPQKDDRHHWEAVARAVADKLGIIVGPDAVVRRALDRDRPVPPAR